MAISMIPTSRIRLVMIPLIRTLLMRPKLSVAIDTNPHFGPRDNFSPPTLLSPELSDITSMSIILRTEMPKTKSEPNTSYCATLAYFQRSETYTKYVLEA